MEDKIVRFSVSLPESLLKKLDEKTLNRGYTSRSELIRDFIRELIIEEKWNADEEVVGVLVMIYNHHQRGLTEKMLEIQHSRHHNILCSNHVHLDHDSCLETIVIKGEPEVIENMATKIAGLKGVKFAKLVKTAIV